MRGPYGSVVLPTRDPATYRGPSRLLHIPLSPEMELIRLPNLCILPGDQPPGQQWVCLPNFPSYLFLRGAVVFHGRTSCGGGSPSWLPTTWTSGVDRKLRLLHQGHISLATTTQQAPRTFLLSPAFIPVPATSPGLQAAQTQNSDSAPSQA